MASALAFCRILSREPNEYSNRSSLVVNGCMEYEWFNTLTLTARNSARISPTVSRISGSTAMSLIDTGWPLKCA